VSGLGDAAVRADAGGVLAVKGDTLVSVDYTAFGEDAKEVPHKLVEIALSHVQK
jgi:hypothetical protein